MGFCAQGLVGFSQRFFFFFIQKWVLTVYPTAINKETLEAKRAHSALLLRAVSPHNTWVAAGHFLWGSFIWTGTWHSLSQWVCRGSPHHCQMLCTGTAPTSLYSSFPSQSTLGEGGRHICPKTREKQQKTTFKLPIITGNKTKAYFGDRSDRRLSTASAPLWNGDSVCRTPLSHWPWAWWQRHHLVVIIRNGVTTSAAGWNLSRSLDGDDSFLPVVRQLEQETKNERNFCVSPLHSVQFGRSLHCG